jgi:diguanylate cyclase (GGDEF)-like protein
MNENIAHRILVIDDQAAIHEDYRKILGRQALASSAALGKAAAELFGDDPATAIEWEGFDVDSAYQGEEGLELVQRSVAEGRPYAMAFVDIRMPPGWDGVETVRHIWEVDPEILIVICSAYSDYTWQELVRELGRNDRYLILKKPFDNIEVRQCAMTLTERWSVSRTDVLTGLLNRRAFRSYLNLEWERSTRHQFPLACAMLDLDGFKQVNDTLGHLAGDRVLRIVAQSMKAQCRASDCVCRYGGDEICVLLPHTSAQEAAMWAENTRGAFESSPITIGEKSVPMTVSIGIAERLAEDDRMERLVDRADQALIRAKAAGRNRLVLASTLNARALDEPRQRVDVWQGLVLSDVMTAPVVCIDAAATVAQAAQCLVQFHVHSAPVVDADGKLVGIVSQDDVFRILPHADAWALPVEQIMCRESGCYDEDAPPEAVCERLAATSTQCVFIVRGGRPIGMVSRRSLLRWYGNHASARAEGTVAAALRISGEIHPGQLADSAQSVAERATQLSRTVSGQADANPLSLTASLSHLQDLVDELLACSKPSHSPAIIKTGPDLPAFGSPGGPLTPLG